MEREKFLRAMRKRTAGAAVGASTLRGARAKGAVAKAREGLGRVNLERFAAAATQDEFTEELNLVTRRLQYQLPKPADQWGYARKALNIFLRDVLYNKYLSRAYEFSHVEPWLELPLDSFTVGHLWNHPEAGDLPKTFRVGSVSPREYALFQAAASRVARQCKIDRVHLDIFWWRLAVVKHT